MSPRSGAGLALPAAGPADGGVDPAGLAFPGGERLWDRSLAAGLPVDVPRWAAAGGAQVRAGAEALDREVALVRRARDTLGSLLVDAAAGLGWRGAGARSAQSRAAALYRPLTASADRLADARDALSRLASELDDRRAGPGSVADTLGAADARASVALHAAARELVRCRGLLATDGRLVGLAPDAGVRAPAPVIADGIGADVGVDVGAGLRRFWAGGLNTAASMANAALNHPEALAEVVAGALLLDVGASGETLGLALDVTGAGALAGVPVGAASAVPLVAGAGLLATGSTTIMLNAAGPDRVTPASGRSGGANGNGGEFSRQEIENASYAQRDASSRFSMRGRFRGETIDSVAAKLRSGTLKPEDVPVDAIRRDGKVLLLNTRSSVALEQAGIPRSEWKVVNRSGVRDFERRLDSQLDWNGLDAGGTKTVTVRGAGHG